ncbi:MAG TPA: bifunctional adenosylcobinamide kinase/adenosylcobinamide-phosphate guanylyltransferase [Acidothermaceae bacterium]
MDVTLLGTGDAPGWPHPFCNCASCAAAYAEGEIRAHSAALIDDAVLIDCGHDVVRSAVRLGVRLDRVRYLLVTHDHFDHASGATLLARRWAGVGPLTLVGPSSALATLSPWLPPADPEVDFRPAAAGDVLTLGAYTVRVLAADHDSDGGVIYDVATSTHRLLYATDTGPEFTTPADAHYDLLLLEDSWGDRPVAGATGHHGLSSFATTLARLRRENAIDDHSRVVAIHLGHGNPAPSILRARLAAMGSDLMPDGAVIRLDEASAASTPARALPRRTLVLGGARSGKSLTAERLLAAAPAVTYVATATAEADAMDAEWRSRIAAHRARRPVHWATVETIALTKLLAAARAEDPPLLIDCVSVWLATIMENAGLWSSESAATASANADVALAEAVDALVLAWRTTAARVVAVSNEVGSGVVPPYPSGRRFRDELGSLNARLAAESDEVLVVEAGISRSLLHPRAVQYPPAVQQGNEEST